ncbi:Uncharacterised protein [Candidatus Burarchaeum australiense]|nr:Uncharacterised protein [Candidatus Burarchaeum australiense]
MKGAFLLLIALVLSPLVSAQVSSALTASLVKPTTPYFYASNCPGSSAQAGPTQQEIIFSVYNPWASAMTVQYDYYDFGNGKWVAGTSQACIVGPHNTENACTLNAPLILGGSGSGTLSDVPFIRLTGVDPTGAQEAATKTFSFTLEHTEMQTETNAMNKITALRDLIANLSSKSGVCRGSFCCGSAGPVFDTAKANLATAEAALKSCNLPIAYNLAANSTNSLKSATTSADPACVNAVSAANSADQQVSAVRDAITTAAAKNCDVTGASEKLSNAEHATTGILALLSQGDYTAASALAANATALAAEATAALNCPATGSNATTIVPAPGPSPTPQTPPASGGGICPAGFALLPLMGLLAWRKLR